MILSAAVLFYLEKEMKGSKERGGVIRLEEGPKASWVYKV